jgi:glyoxylate/hydroxypyruvate reductase
MALLFRSSVDSEARWKPQLARLMPELEVRVWPEIGDPAEIGSTRSSAMTRLARTEA